MLISWWIKPTVINVVEFVTIATTGNPQTLVIYLHQEWLAATSNNTGGLTLVDTLHQVTH